VTDKYTRKKPIRWGKPCIYLNNQDPLEANLPDWQKQWLQANCIFVNLDHRLYSPEAMLPPLFAPRPIHPLLALAQEENEPGPSRVVDKGKGKGREGLMAGVNCYLSEGKLFYEDGSSWGPRDGYTTAE
jgi:hypothetical protein